jgi:hydroxyacylglutathione hydrolase
MRIDRRLGLVGSGALGFDLSDPFDCNVFIADAGGEHVLFDAGAGLGADAILAVCREDGVDPDRIRHLVLTHAHGDHGGGAAHLRDRLPGLVVHAAPRTAEIVAAGDEDAVSMPAARRAGIYPPDYVDRACPVDEVVPSGGTIRIGELGLTAVPTPGHSHDHHCWLVEAPSGPRCLVGGDALFVGGRVALQHIYDCSVPDVIASIERLAELEFDALLPGHLAFSMHGAKRHVDAAMAVIARLGCPDSII